MSNLIKNYKYNMPPLWLSVIAIIIVLALVTYIIGSDLYGSIYPVVEGFHNPYFNPYPYPPPNPHLYPSYYHNSISYNPYNPYNSYGYYPPQTILPYYAYGFTMPRPRVSYIPYDPLHVTHPMPMTGHTEAYYYDRYRRLAESNKANNPYKYHYDAEGELIDSKEATYYDHQPWNQPTRSSWGWGWLW